MIYVQSYFYMIPLFIFLIIDECDSCNGVHVKRGSHVPLKGNFWKSNKAIEVECSENIMWRGYTGAHKLIVEMDCMERNVDYAY
jgi:hypothetical protein